MRPIFIARLLFKLVVNLLVTAILMSNLLFVPILRHMRDIWRHLYHKSRGNRVLFIEVLSHVALCGLLLTILVCLLSLFKWFECL